MMFEAEEIRQLIEVAPVQIKAMILLGVNCGFGNADCGRLPFSAVDLEGGWVNFPRPKTGIDRRCPLWPETSEAIKRAVSLRPEPRPADAQCVFITDRGRRRWCNGESASTLTKAIRKLVKKTGIGRDGLGFYGLRRTFETIGGETIDQVAVDFIMGHAPSGSDMAALYRQRISDERLRVVTEHVRIWLFPDEAANFFRRFQAKARQIHDEWEATPALMAATVLEAMKRLGVKQSELARGVGLNAIWVNAVLQSRSPLSSQTEKRLRHFFWQLAEGQTPTPLPKHEPPRFDKPSDVPLTDEAREALVHWPMTSDDLKTIAACLGQFGITQTKLAEWWGYTYKFYAKMRYMEKPIPPRGADRLRVAFGFPSAFVEPALPMELSNEPGKIYAPPAIEMLLNGDRFGAAELKAVVKYLRRRFIHQRKIEKWIGVPRDELGRAKSSDELAAKCQALLRPLFARSRPTDTAG